MAQSTHPRKILALTLGGLSIAGGIFLTLGGFVGIALHRRFR